MNHEFERPQTGIPDTKLEDYVLVQTTVVLLGWDSLTFYFATNIQSYMLN